MGDTYRAGKIISARSLNETDRAARASAKPAVGDRMEVLRTSIGNLQRYLDQDSTTSAGGGLLVHVLSGIINVDAGYGTKLGYIAVSLVDDRTTAAPGGPPPRGGNFDTAPPHDNYRWLYCPHQPGDNTIGVAGQMPPPYVGQIIEVVDLGQSLVVDLGDPGTSGDVATAEGLEDFTDDADGTIATHGLVEFPNYRYYRMLFTGTLDNVADSDTHTTPYITGPNGEYYLLGFEPVYDPSAGTMAANTDVGQAAWVYQVYQPANGVDGVPPITPGAAYNCYWTGQSIELVCDIFIAGSWQYGASITLPVFATRDFPCGVNLGCSGDPLCDQLGLAG